jgi:hypothetical protein
MERSKRSNSSKGSNVWREIDDQLANREKAIFARQFVAVFVNMQMTSQCPVTLSPVVQNTGMPIRDIF